MVLVNVRDLDMAGRGLISFHRFSRPIHGVRPESRRGKRADNLTTPGGHANGPDSTDVRAIVCLYWAVMETGRLALEYGHSRRQVLRNQIHHDHLAHLP